MFPYPFLAKGTTQEEDEILIQSVLNLCTSLVASVTIAQQGNLLQTPDPTSHQTKSGGTKFGQGAKKV